MVVKDMTMAAEKAAEKVEKMAVSKVEQRVALKVD